jgi:hypothetical protein
MTLRVVKVVLLAVMAGALLIAATASARGPEAARGRIWRPVSRPNFSVSLIGGHGSALRNFMSGGQTFVLGEPGERYVIRIQNPTNRRVEAVISVDGRDAVSGQRADFVRQRGYVIEPFGSVSVEGFRTSMEQVRAFRFTDPSDSYAARMGTPENVGVIGVAFFPERDRSQQQIARRDRRRFDAPRSAAADGEASAAPRPKAGAAESRGGRANNLGTEFGEGRMSSVMEVSFVRENASRPAQIVVVRYDDVEGLQARGIDVFGDRLVRRVREPEPFPQARFAQPPR